MKILVTGANGYIGQRLIPELLKQGHEVIALVRDPKRFKKPAHVVENQESKIRVLKADLLDSESLKEIPNDIDVAYYLVHSMSSSGRDFSEMEEESATNFLNAINKTDAKQVVYLSGIVNDKVLSKHLKSRLKVEEILKQGKFALTSLRAAIIIGSGSASFEIIRDLVEKLPVMVAPRWVKTRCQPIAIRDVISYLVGVAMQEKSFNRVFDIGGPDLLNYKEMLLSFAKVRELKRIIITVPVLTPKLSSYWLYFVTSIGYSLARSLVDSMSNEVICNNSGIEEIVPGECLSYEDAISRAFQKIEQNEIISSWTDALNQSKLDHDFLENIEVPIFGCLIDERNMEIKARQGESYEDVICRVKNKIWSIGGKNGWYYMNWAWQLRGFLDKIFGGVGLRKGREVVLKEGDALDFWRVLLADEENMRLILYAEMKVPGEAWLEFSIFNKEGKSFLKQKASFRPHGLLGRLYWYLLSPFHNLIFQGMAARICA